jgi:uncharacterized protein (DUF1015 family)
MAVIRTFRAVRPVTASAERVAAVPYDVVDTDEARALAADNPLSFLHVSRAEIDLPSGLDPHDDLVYHTAAERYRWLKREAPLVQEQNGALYLYRLSANGHQQTGIAGSFSLADYDANIIKKHERTRKDKEDDRTRHIFELRAQTGPVFLTYRPQPDVDAIVDRTARTSDPVADFQAADGVRHAVWRLDASDAAAVTSAFAAIDALYIADGHHRAASAARTRELLPGVEEANYFLAVAFPSSEVRILPYNRVVRDLNGLTAEEFLRAMRQLFEMKSGPRYPDAKGQVSMYVDRRWHLIELATGGGPHVADRLDYNVLQERILTPVLGIGDVRTDKRIEFVGGARGVDALERLVDSGKAAVAFSMHPVSLGELMNVSDAGEIMPPKSTWFEPKLRDGLLIHEV